MSALRYKNTICCEGISYPVKVDYGNNSFLLSKVSMEELFANC